MNTGHRTELHHGNKPLLWRRSPQHRQRHCKHHCMATGSNCPFFLMQKNEAEKWSSCDTVPLQCLTGPFSSGKPEYCQVWWCCLYHVILHFLTLPVHVRMCSWGCSRWCLLQVTTRGSPQFLWTDTYPRSKHCFGEELFMYSNHDSGRWRVLRGILTGLNILSRLAFEGTGKKPHAFKRWTVMMTC